MIIRKFKTRFIHSSLRNRLNRKLREEAIQPYKWAEQNNINQTAVYRLLSNHNLSPGNYEKVKKALEPCK
jgi:predicted transcriptional regulator